MPASVFRCLQEQIHTANPGGRFYLHILAALAELERELIAERTKAAWLQHDDAASMSNGRASSLQQLPHAGEVIESGEETRAGVAALFGVNVATLRPALGREAPVVRNV